MEELLNKLKELNAIRAIGNSTDYEPTGKHKNTIYFAEDTKQILFNGEDYGGKSEAIIIDEINLYDCEEAFLKKRAVVTLDIEKANSLNSKFMLAYKRGLNVFMECEGIYWELTNIIVTDDGISATMLISNYDDVSISNFSSILLHFLILGVNVYINPENITSKNDFTDTLKDKLDSLPTNEQLNNRIENSAIVLSETWDAQLVDAFNNLDNKKVDKVEGKQLSTEDFTASLKQKLEGLTNYDDAELTAKVNELKTNLDTILDSENTTAVIDTFQEIEAFLAGITNTETLTGLLQDLKSEIIALIPEKKAIVLDIDFDSLVYNLLNDDEYEIDSETLEYIKSKLDESIETGVKVYARYYLAPANSNDVPYNTLYEVFNIRKQYDYRYDFSIITNEHKFFMFHIDYNNISIYDLSIDRAYNLHANRLNSEDLNYITSYYFTVFNGRYNNTCTNLPSNINTSKEFSLIVSPISSDKYCQTLIDKAGTIFRRIHDGYSNSWTEWKQLAFIDSNVASADKLTTKQLTNEDLNEIKTDGVVYFAIGSNTCTNCPTTNSGFNLQVLKVADGQYVQIFTVWSAGHIFKRAFNSTTWSSWQQLATTDGAVAKLTTKQLTNEDLNTIKDMNFSSYFAAGENTCTNTPTLGQTKYFSLQVFAISSGRYAQIVINSLGDIYKRVFIGTWTDWKKMLTEDDVQIKLVTEAEYNALTTKNSNTLYCIAES